LLLYNPAGGTLLGDLSSEHIVVGGILLLIFGIKLRDLVRFSASNAPKAV
jgi:hypothetical protein